MIEIGRRGFITGLVRLVAAPAVIRVAPLMPISARHVPLYVPVQWLLSERSGADLKSHAWPRRLDDNWVDLNDFNPRYVRDWALRLEEGAERRRWRGYA